MKVTQIENSGEKFVVTAAISSKELINLVVFSEKKDDTWDPYKVREKDLNPESRPSFFQRVTERIRVKSISDYILDYLKDRVSNPNGYFLPLFPSAMILSFRLTDDVLLPDDESELSSLTSENFEDKGLIVDGQHRLAGMIRAIEELKAKAASGRNEDVEKMLKIAYAYKFNCTLLLNYDIYEQALVFANVNFKQKSVNKSIYYDIFGSIPPVKGNDLHSKLYIAHDLVKFLNTSDKSPIKGFVKMLGRGSGYFSQAMMVEAILDNFSSKGAWPSIEDSFLNNPNASNNLARVHVGFFNAVKNLFNIYWPSENDKNGSIIVKTTGMRSLLYLLGYSYRLLSLNLYPNIDLTNIDSKSTEEYTELYKKLLLPLKSKADELFGPDSIFSGAGSQSLQRKLFHKMCVILEIHDLNRN